MARRKSVLIFGVALSLFLNIAVGAVAQAWEVSTNLNKTASELVDSVLGNGITASNVVRSGTVYEFSDGLGTIGIDSGIVLDTSGRVGNDNKDTDLEGILDYSYGGHTSSLEFELEATGTLLNFNYAFASSEFSESAQYNDAFGLFVSVNGSKYENIAKITRSNGSEVPVNIQNLKYGLDGSDYISGSPVYGKTYSLYRAINVRFYSTDYISVSQGGTNGVSNVFNAQKAVAVGDKVKVKFVIADVSDTAYDSYVMIEGSSLSFDPPGAVVDYIGDDMEDLEENTEYIIKIGDDEYEVTSDSEGKIPLVTDDYNLYGETFIIYKKGFSESPQEVTVQPRPAAPVMLEPDENDILPDTIEVTETSITITAGSGQEYRIDDEDWRDADENGVVAFTDLEPNTEHTVYTRYAATDDTPASESSPGVVYRAVRPLEYTVTNYQGYYDKKSHSAKVTCDYADGIYYSADLYGTYSVNKVGFTEIGTYPVYFMIKKAGYYTAHGTLSVEILEAPEGWEPEPDPEPEPTEDVEEEIEEEPMLVPNTGEKTAYRNVAVATIGSAPTIIAVAVILWKKRKKF